MEVLWLADNQITRVEGVATCCRLREVNLARNRIRHVGPALGANTALEVLNVAENDISSFREVGHLATLPRLSDLCFADPHWGACPLAQLCNYQTYALFRLQHVTCLDTLILTPHAKTLAEATFLKK